MLQLYQHIQFQLIPETGERREAYSVLFKKMLNTRALALITYLNTERYACITQ